MGGYDVEGRKLKKIGDAVTVSIDKRYPRLTGVSPHKYSITGTSDSGI